DEGARAAPASGIPLASAKAPRRPAGERGVAWQPYGHRAGAPQSDGLDTGSKTRQGRTFCPPWRSVMRKFAIVAGSMAIAFLAVACRSWATPPNNTAFVDPKGGADSAGCGAVTSQCATLNQALANISSGGTVYVQSGATFGPIALTTSVSIV